MRHTHIRITTYIALDEASSNVHVVMLVYRIEVRARVIDLDTNKYNIIHILTRLGEANQCIQL